MVDEMDTPVKDRIATPISKIEDSPVFNYINSLSPIQTAKSLHITQSFNPLNFASLPSIFTSPHVSSFNDSRFLRRHQSSDPSKPELSENEKKDFGEKIFSVNNSSSEQRENFGLDSSAAETSAPYDCLELETAFSGNLSYNCVNPVEKNAIKAATTSSAVVSFVERASSSGHFGSEINVEGMSEAYNDKDLSGCDWGNLICDDLLNFESPNNTGSYRSPDENQSDPTKLPGRNCAIDAVVSTEKHQTDNPSGVGEDLRDMTEDQEMVACTSLDDCLAVDTADILNDEIGSNLQRGMRRRCLVFDMVGARRKHLTDGSGSVSSPSLHPNDTIASNVESLVPRKTAIGPSRCKLPGIGLHLNSLATTSIGRTDVKHDALTSGRQLIIGPSSSAPYQSFLINQDPFAQLSAPNTSEVNLAPAQTGFPAVEEASQPNGFINNVESIPSSPKKKRRRMEQGEENDCKRCNCKKSKCLKLYCECFAAGVYCCEPCACQDCHNKPIHEDTVLATRKQIESRNPLAFAPKVIRTADPVQEIGGIIAQEDSSKTPASARHKRGCNCKKSGCLKKYCECYQGGVGCSINCRCEGCKNAFGQKNGSAFLGSEVDMEEDEANESEKSVIDRGSDKTLMQNDAEQHTAIPSTPLRTIRSNSMQLSVSSKSKPPRSFLSSGTSSKTFTRPRSGKLNPFDGPGKFGPHFNTVQEDEIPDFLQATGSPISGVKSASPNSKRVSPPHGNLRPSPGQRSSRKLILQSIPSFSLNSPKD